MDDHTVIRNMKENDLSGIMEIERIVFSFPWSSYSFLTELHNPNAYYLVAVYLGKVVAYGGLWLISTEAHITTIAVDPSYHRKGFGSALLKALLSYVWEQEGLTVSLEVRRSNKSAEAFYLQHGFTYTEIIRAYYVGDGEDAIKMTYFKRAQQYVIFLLIHYANNLKTISVICYHPKLGLKEIRKTAIESENSFSGQGGGVLINSMITANQLKLSELEAIALYCEAPPQIECLEAVLFVKGLAYGLCKPCIILSGKIDDPVQTAFYKILYGDCST